MGRLLKHDIDGAREHLRRLLGTITLKPTDGALLAIVQGDLAGILPVGNLGAGSPVRLFPTSLTLPLVARLVS